jgi:DNA-binding MarR family transcriptional regulator
MPSQAILSAEITDKLLKAMLVLSRTIEHIMETRAVEEAVDKPLSSSKVRVLRLLGNRGAHTSVQIARHLGVSKPAVTQIVGSLVRSKLVVRQPGWRDRREIALQLTTLGKEKFRAVRQEQRHLVRNALRLYEDGQAEQWIDTLQEIATAVAQADEAFEKYCFQCGAHADGTCILVGGDASCPFLQHRSAASDPSGARRRS